MDLTMILKVKHKYQNLDLQILMKLHRFEPVHSAVQQIYMVLLMEAMFCLKNKIQFRLQAKNQDLLN